MKNYSVRRLGNTSWIDTDDLAEARKELEIANRTVSPGHVLIDNREQKKETDHPTTPF